MNIFSLKQLFIGEFERNALEMAFRYAEPISTGYYKRLTGKHKTFKKNLRRGL